MHQTFSQPGAAFTNVRLARMSFERVFLFANDCCTFAEKPRGPKISLIKYSLGMSLQMASVRAGHWHSGKHTPPTDTRKPSSLK